MTLLTWHIAGQASYKVACPCIGLSLPGTSVPVQCARFFMAKLQPTCAAHTELQELVSHSSGLLHTHA